MKKIVILTALIAVSIMSVYAENPFKARTYTSTDGVELNYRALEPETKGPAGPLRYLRPALPG